VSGRVASAGRVRAGRADRPGHVRWWPSAPRVHADRNQLGYPTDASGVATLPQPAPPGRNHTISAWRDLQRDACAPELQCCRVHGADAHPRRCTASLGGCPMTARVGRAVNPSSAVEEQSAGTESESAGTTSRANVTADGAADSHARPATNRPAVEPTAPAGQPPDEPATGLPVGSQAIRVFRAARRRRLAMPADQRPRPSPGLIAQLEARGWDIPPELRAEPEAKHDIAHHDRPPSPATSPRHGRQRRRRP
jgi:hypothetical protein